MDVVEDPEHRQVRLTDMKIICLVKQVPRGDEIRFDEETRSLVREGVSLELNRFDAYALAHAARLRRRGEVVALTMGPPQAEEALRMALALGADRGMHLSDRVFAVADTLGTSRALALAIRERGRRPRPLRAQDDRLGDLAGAGRGGGFPRSAAGDRRRRARAGRRQAAGVRRLGDEGEETYELELPGLCSVALPPDGAELDAEPVAGAEAGWSGSRS